MLDCTHPPFTAIREEAQQEQGIRISKLLDANPTIFRKHFIHQFAKASWTSSPNIDRIWLGLWNTDTLKELMRPSLKSPLSNQSRQSYIHLTRKLTSPLTDAYYKMQDILTKTTQPITQPPPTHHNAEHTHNTHSIFREIIDNTHIQHSSHQAPSLLNHTDSLSIITSFTISDAAFATPNADTTF